MADPLAAGTGNRGPAGRSVASASMADENNEPTDSDADGSATSDHEPAAEKPAANAPKKVVAKKKVVSKRVTPKGGATPGSTSAHAHAADGDDAAGSKRYTPPSAKYQDMPSPPWVPVLMFVLLGFGCLFIIVNYAGLFGDPENWRLLIGLASILGGIIAATNYR